MAREKINSLTGLSALKVTAPPSQVSQEKNDIASNIQSVPVSEQTKIEKEKEEAAKATAPVPRHSEITTKTEKKQAGQLDTQADQADTEEIATKQKPEKESENKADNKSETKSKKKPAKKLFSLNIDEDKYDWLFERALNQSAMLKKRVSMQTLINEAIEDYMKKYNKK